MNRRPRINKTERTDQLVELTVDRSAPASLAINGAIKISAHKKVMSSVKEGIEITEEFRTLRLVVAVPPKNSNHSIIHSLRLSPERRYKLNEKEFYQS